MMTVQQSEPTDPLAGDPVEEPAVTGRPADTAPENSTFGSRAKAVGSSENKAVGGEETKSSRRRK